MCVCTFLVMEHSYKHIHGKKNDGGHIGTSMFFAFPTGDFSPARSIGVRKAGSVRSERMVRRHGGMYVIGIDEAGRGPLAGPVVVGGVKVSIKRRAKNGKLLRGIKDSKKLSAKKRDEWFRVLTKNADIEWVVASVPPSEIDRINIHKATNKGVHLVYKKLAGRAAVPALLDGSLYLPKGIPYTTIIKGDEKIPIISAASIIAKVTRDRLMLRLHKKYPKYRFDIHKGYGTKLHIRFIKTYGLSPIHRRSFRLKA